MSDTPPVPKIVSRFESNLLRILRFYLKQFPQEQALRLIQERLERPKCLSAAAVHLACDSLSKGVVLYLVRGGAWKRDRYMRNGNPKFGRLWERTPVEQLTLSFTRPVLDFLMWITSIRAKEEKTAWKTDVKKLTVADQLFFYLAYDAMRVDSDWAAVLRQSSVFGENALIWLAHPSDFASDKPPSLPPFDVWLSEPGSLILEALQPILEQRWLDTERRKGQIGDWTQMNQQGQMQFRVADQFTNAVNHAGRRDLVRFLLSVMARVLSAGEMLPTFWTGGLQGNGPPRLADRLETQRNALALLRQAGRFQTWELDARRSGYMDEDYAASKFWLSEWDRFNFGTIAERAERIVQQVEPLRIG